MTDKKFPYIVLPSLSSGDKDPANSAVPNSASTSNSSNSKRSDPSSSSLKTGRGGQAGSKSTSSSSSSGQSQSQSSVPATKGLARHIALSKQFSSAGNSSPTVSSSRPSLPSCRNQESLDLQSIRTRQGQAPALQKPPPPALIISQLKSEQRHSRNAEGDDQDAESSPFPALKRNTNISQEDSPPTLSLAAISQILHPRSKQKSKSFLDKVLEKEKDGNGGIIPAPASSSSSNSDTSLTLPSNICQDTLLHLKKRLDSLTHHVKEKDGEIRKLKEAMSSLEHLLLSEQKQAVESTSLMERLGKDLEILNRQLGSLELKLRKQERSSSLFQNLFFMEDGEVSSESEGDEDSSKSSPPSQALGKKASTSTASSLTSVPSIPCFSAFSAGQGSGSGDGGGIGYLKECVNWVPIAPDFDKLVSVITLLNFRVERTQGMKYSKGGKEATFKHPETLQITLYQNGLVLGKSEFRSYATLSVIKMLNEMFNGYFPTEFQTKYPDGVVFSVVDRRSVQHDLSPGFFGQGVKLGTDSQSVPRLKPGNCDFSRTRSLPQLQCKKSGDTENSSCFNTNPADIVRKSYIALPDLNPSSPKNHKAITLKIKNVENGVFYKLRTSTGTKIDYLRFHLESSLKPEDSEEEPRFDLLLPLPYGILCSGTSTLKDYGIVTNCLLYIQPQPSRKSTEEDSPS